jgi:hypothetical protein
MMCIYVTRQYRQLPDHNLLPPRSHSSELAMDKKQDKKKDKKQDKNQEEKQDKKEDGKQDGKQDKKPEEKQDKTVKWSNEDEATLLQVLTDEKAKGTNWGDNNPTKEAWTVCLHALAGSEQRSGGTKKNLIAIKGRWQRVSPSSHQTLRTTNRIHVAQAGV